MHVSPIFRLSPFVAAVWAALGAFTAPAHAALLGGDTPATATVLSSLNFTDTGTTVGADNTINTLPAGVSTYTTVAGPDVFYRFFVVTGGSVTFSLLPQSGYDAAIYLLKDGTLGTNAIIGRDSAFSGGNESFTTTLVAGSTYYFAVDSFYGSSNSLRQGAYTLSVTSTAVVGQPPASVPEPGTLGLLGAAALGLAGSGLSSGWRARRKARG